MSCELASEGVAAIFGPNSAQTSKTVGSVCNKLGIPHIIAQWTPGEVRNAAEQHAYTQNFFPNNNLYARALGQIVDSNTWKGFTLLYDTNESLEKLQDVLEIQRPNDNPITIRQLPEDGDYKSLLKFVEKQETHVIIDCSPAKVMEIFKQTFDIKMIGEYQRYFITSFDVHTLNFTEFKFSLTNITTIRLMDPTSDEVINAVQDWNTYQKEKRASAYFDVNQIRTETTLFYDAVKTFLTSFRAYNDIETVRPMKLDCNVEHFKWDHDLKFMKHLNEKTNYKGMTGRIRFDDKGNRNDFYMEVLEKNRKEDGFTKISILDPITMNITQLRTSEEEQSQLTESIQSKVFKVASILGPPFLTMRQAAEGEYLEGNNKYEGYSLDLIEAIVRENNFRFEFDIVKDNKQGSFDKKTKKWNGLVKRLLDRVGDSGKFSVDQVPEPLGNTEVSATASKSNKLSIRILYVKPHKEKPDLFSFMSPLSLQVWLYMATAYLCISVLLFLLAKTAADDWSNPHPCNTDPDELETIWNMHNCIWLTVGSIMQQGCDILPKAISTRLTAGLWWFFALIVISSYTANLAAFLTMERMESTIESAEGLAQQNKIKYGGVEGGSTLGFFKTSNFSTYHRMWAAMEAAETPIFVKNNEEGVNRVINGNRKYAFLMESSMIDYYREQYCELTQIGNLLDSKGYGIGMPFNSPYRTIISRTVLKMQEDGKLLRLKTKWWKRNETISKDECDKDTQDDYATPELGMLNVGGVFLVLTYGLAISILIGALEFLWSVSKISAAEKITPWEAFKSELLFALDIRITTKPVHKTSSERSGSVSNSSSKSIEADLAGGKFNVEEKQKNKV